MAQYESSYQGQQVRTTGTEEVSGWAIGFTMFAAVMLLVLGTFHFISGLAAILDDTFYVVRNNYALEFDVSTWGWIHLVGGIIVGVAGVGLFTGNLAARIVAIAVAFLSIIWNFFSIPYYPVWSILQIALAVGVIWALTVHGNAMSQEE